MNVKKIIIVVLALLVIVIGGIFLFSLRQKQVIQQKQQEQQKTEEEQKKTDLLQKLTGTDVAGFWLYNNALNYLDDSGRILSVSGGKETPVAETPLVEPVVLGVSSGGTKVLIASRSSRQISMYDSASRTLTDLSSDVYSASWSPDGRLAQLRSVSKGRSAVELTDANESAPNEIVRVALQDAIVQWPAPGILALAPLPSKYYAASAYTINPSAGTVSLIATDKRGLMLLWSPSGLYALASWLEKGTLQSALIAPSGKIIKGLSSPVMPAKCAFANETKIMCGAPQNIDLAKAPDMPDAYLMQSLDVADRVIAIDKDSEHINIIFEREAAFLDVYKPFVSGDKLFFINRNDGSVYSLKLVD